MNLLLYGAYQLLLTLLLPFGALFWAVKALTDKRYRGGVAQRLGLWPRITHGAVWIHGASLGEIRAVAPLIRALKDRNIPLVVTATSATGREEADKLLSGYGHALYLPLDHFLPLFLAFKRARPSVLVIAETEIWPGLYAQAHAANTPIVITSGRISDKSFPRYLKLKPLMTRILSLVEGIQAQAPIDVERYIALGAPENRIFVGGNMKFDLPPPDATDPLAVSLRRAKAGNFRVMVGGSVHPGEAGVIFHSAALLKEKGVRLGLVVAPRHLEKMEEIERELSGYGLTGVRWSELKKPLEASIIESFRAGKTILVDRVGLLSRLYGGAEVAVVGGSFVPVGGHNLLEPLQWGIPVIFGPHMNNSPDIRDEVTRRGLGVMVMGAEGISEAATGFLVDQEARARIKTDSMDFFEANRGALLMAVEAVLAARNGVAG